MISLTESQPSGGGAGLVARVEEMFGPNGFLSRSKNFEYRAPQQAMAVAVARALEQGEDLLVEAGTGVGKSLAYLIPSILHAVERKKKAIVSTHTINLQEQLTQKDLPMLAEALPVKFRYAMLKGRGNYLCLRRLHKALRQSDGLFTSPERAELERIAEWAKQSDDGSISDLEIEPDSRVWAEICSERGICSPKLCGPQSDHGKEFGSCFFQRARQRILSADVLVLNHTLFFTLLGGDDEEDHEGILFKNDFVIFDEAHTLEQVASKHIGLTVSQGQLRFALQRLWNPKTGKGLLGVLGEQKCIDLTDSLLHEADRFFESVEEACEGLAQKSEGRFRSSGTSTQAAGESGSPAESGGKARTWAEVRIRRPELVEDNVSLPIQRLRTEVAELVKLAEDKDSAHELSECNRRLGELRDGVAIFLNQSAEEHVYWVERAGKVRKNFSLHAAPVEVADFLRDRLFESDSSVLMTSATLAISAERNPTSKPRQMAAAPLVKPSSSGRSPGLGYFAQRVGGESAELLQVGSPFNYAKQMKLYVVGKMPDPREREYRDALVHWIEHFVKLTHGKAFVLFTNFRLMHDVAQSMEPFFDRLGIECFVQGTGTPRSRMLEKFKEDIDSVLFGTDSFWQGVDVPGEALSNVIITRLPFAVPDHPLVEARLERIETRGGNAFAEFSLPEAVLKFRQGIGRLIRSKEDTGIVVVLDNRILTKRYGQTFMGSIPDCPVEIV